MVDRSDVELAIRVKDLASAPFNQVAEAVEKLTTALDEQVEQARTGKISVGELRESLDKLRQAEQSLLSQQGLIDRFNRQSEKLKEATAAAQANAAALAAHSAKLKDGETATKTWTREQAKLETQGKRVSRTVEDLSTDLTRVTGALQAADIDTKDLAASQARLLAVSMQVGQAKTVTSAAIAGYSRNVRLAREEVRRLAQEERAAAAAGAASPAAGPAQTGAPRRGRGGETGLFGLRGFELQNLGYQVNDVFTQLAGGTGIGQVIGQQGGQILQIFNRNLFDLIALIPRFLPLIAGVTAGILAVNRAAADRESTRAFKADLLATTSALAYQADKLTEIRRSVQQFGVAWADSGEAMRQAVGSGVSQDRLADMLRTAQAIADRTGGKTPDVMKGLVEGFSGGYEALLKLNEQYQFLDVNSAKALKDLYDEGKQAEANAKAYEILAQKQQAAAAVLEGPWTRAMREVLMLGRSFTAWLSDTAPIQILIRYYAGLATAIGNVANALRLAGEEPDTVRLENRAKQLEAGIASSGRDARMLGLTDEQAAARLDQLKASLADINGRIAAARASPTATGDIVNGRPVDDIRLQGTLSGLKKQTDAAKGLTEQEELRLRIAQALTEEQAKGPLSDAGRKALEEQVTALYDAELTTKRTAETNQRALALAREKAQKEREIADFLRDQGLASAKLLADDSERIRLAGQKAREDLRSRGGEFVTDAQLDQAQRNAEKLARDEINKAAASKAATAGESQITKANALQTQLASLTSGGGNRSLLDLDARLTAIDAKFAALGRNIETFRRAGGTSIGGRPVADFQSEVSTARERAKDLERIKTQEEEIARIVQERNSLVQTYNALQQTGSITQTEAMERVKKAYADSAPEIERAAAALEDLLAKTTSLPTSQVDVLTAKIKLFRAEARPVDVLTANLNKNIESAFSGAVTGGLETMTNAMAQFVAGTATAGDVVKAFGVSVLKIFGDVASSIAATIVKFYALRALESTMGGSAGSWISTILGLAGGAAGGAFSSPALTASISPGLGAGFSGVTSAGFNVMHRGGIVGQTASPLRTLPIDAFANAPRYHGGGMVGLRPDEQAAVLQKGEEVLARDNPRNAANGGGGGVAIRNVLVMDPGEVAGAMSGAAGERVFLQHVKANMPTIRQLLR